MGDNKSDVVSLRDASQTLASLTIGDIRGALSQIGSAAEIAQCDSLCDCNVRYCTCHGADSSLTKFYEVSMDEFKKLREDRIAELKLQLETLQN